MNEDTIRIAVLSDTHGLLRRCVVQAVQDCSVILHAGDIIHESDLDELAVNGSIYAVRGNNDIWMPGVCDLAGILRFQIGGVRLARGAWVCAPRRPAYRKCSPWPSAPWG